MPNNQKAPSTPTVHKERVSRLGVGVVLNPGEKIVWESVARWPAVLLYWLPRVWLAAFVWTGVAIFVAAKHADAVFGSANYVVPRAAVALGILALVLPAILAIRGRGSVAAISDQRVVLRRRNSGHQHFVFYEQIENIREIRSLISGCGSLLIEVGAVPAPEGMVQRTFRIVGFPDAVGAASHLRKHLAKRESA